MKIINPIVMMMVILFGYFGAANAGGLKGKSVIFDYDVLNKSNDAISGTAKTSAEPTQYLDIVKPGAAVTWATLTYGGKPPYDVSTEIVVYAERDGGKVEFCTLNFRLQIATFAIMGDPRNTIIKVSRAGSSVRSSSHKCSATFVTKGDGVVWRAKIVVNAD